MKKINRVRKSMEFQALIHTGKKVLNESFVMYFSKKKEPACRIGITLSKKMGNAVVRNKIKRQVRMMCEELVNFSVYEYDIVLIIRHGYSAHSYADNKNNLEKLLLKATMK